MSNVFLIILNWNRKEDTLSCLNSLRKVHLGENHLTIVVVDNASTDNSQVETRAYLKKMSFQRKGLNGILIKNKKNLGFAEGNNVGMRYSIKKGADYVILLNNDTFVDENFLTSLMTFSYKHPNLGVASPKIYFAPGYEFHKDRYKPKDKGKVIWYAGGLMDWDNVYGTNFGVDKVDKGQFDKPKTTDFATGACMLIPRQVLEKAGLFDSKYFMYLEDADLSERVKKSGFEVWYIPQCHIWHKVAQSSGIGSQLNDYFITRNRMMFGQKYAPFRTKIALIRESVRLLYKGRPWQRIGIKDYYLGKFDVGSWEKKK